MNHSTGSTYPDRMPPVASLSRLPFLYYSTADQPEEFAFDTWRRLMAPMYDIAPSSRGGRHPGGGTIAYLLGDVLANRTVFSAQHVTRDRKRVETTPDHILFQLWRTGGYIGQVAGQAVTVGSGTVAFSDRRRTLDTHFASSDTIGLVVPRTVLAGIDLEAQGLRFDPARNRLLTARINALYRQLADTGPAEVPALRAELIAFLRRLLDPSKAADVLEGAELDRGLLALAKRSILANLGSPALAPATVAADLRISRPTLYRLFVQWGGVMQFVHEQRLHAIHVALADPLETRTLARLAAEHGVRSPAQLSRSFRARFGTTPRAWREHCRSQAISVGQQSPEPFWRWFDNLGHRDRATNTLNS